MKSPLLSASLAFLTLAVGLSAQVAVTGLRDQYTQNFNTLPTSGSNYAWTDNGSLASWYTNHQMYATSGGGTQVSGLYSLGGGRDRALGGIANITTPVQLALRLVNNTDATIDSLNLAYRGEQWRRDNSVGTTIGVAYRTFTAGEGSVSEGRWNDAGESFVFRPPATGAPAAIDGNATGNFANLGGTLTSLNWAPGQELWIRWTISKTSGENLALGIDDVVVSNFVARR